MSSKIDFVFFGTDEFSVGILDGLKNSGYLPELIITTPGEINRRGEIEESPTEIWAKENGVALSHSLPPKACQLFIVASYGKIIPQSVLDIPKFGALNVHPSLLPNYRGPTPLQTSILNGDSETGVTIMQMDAEMDHGPIVATKNTKLGTRNFVELRTELAKTGAALLAEILPVWIEGNIKPKSQNHAGATFTKKFTKADAELRSEDADEVKYRKVLALNPKPGTWLIDRGTRLKVKSARLLDGRFIPDRVIPEGKREMSWEDYLRGRR